LSRAASHIIMLLSTRVLFFWGLFALLIILQGCVLLLSSRDFIQSLSMGNHCDHNKVVDYNNTTTTALAQAQQQQHDESHNDHHASPILFVHFQKAAGTTVCEIMKKQVNITDMMGNPRTTGNCNVQVGGTQNHAPYYHSLQTCRLLEIYTEKHQTRVPFTRFNFVAVEVPFHDAMPCPGFRSFALMRRPVERFVSLMRYQPSRFPKDKVVRWIDNKEASSIALRRGHMDGYPTVNSMVIRQLLGRRRFLNLTPVDDNDLESAKRQVDAFDAFVPMEYLMNEKVLQVLNRSIPEFVQGLTLSSVHKNKNQHPDMEFDEDFLKRIADENIYDSMLYQYVLDNFGITQNQSLG
jgi:hypothetical protein